MIGVPLTERSSVNLDNAVLDESISPDQLVVGSVIDHVQDPSFAGDCLGCPVEVSFLESQSSELEVTSSNSDSSDSSSVRDEFSVGKRSGLLEGSFLLVDWHSSSGESALVP
jgi:hypothetical protein